MQKLKTNLTPTLSAPITPGKMLLKYGFEKGEDCEPLLILRESWWYTDTKKPNHWLVGNVYSALEHNREYSETEFRELVRSGKVKSQYQ